MIKFSSGLSQSRKSQGEMVLFFSWTKKVKSILRQLRETLIQSIKTWWMFMFDQLL